MYTIWPFLRRNICCRMNSTLNFNFSFLKNFKLLKYALERHIDF